MELYKKTQIVKGLITHFLKINGFTKHYKGYIKNINHLVIKIGVIDFSDEEETKKFKVLIRVNPEKPIGLSRVLGFIEYNIPKGELFITINENIDIEELRICIKNYLNDLLNILNKYNNVEDIVKELQEEINNLNYSIKNRKKILEDEPNNQKISISINLLEEKIKILNNYINEVRANCT